jgi:tetratricopeptide (TPR) repeat protein
MKRKSVKKHIAAVLIVFFAASCAYASVKQELLSILPAPGQKYSLTSVVLKLSKIADPDMDYDWCLSEINSMVDDLKPAISSARTPEEKISAINTLLFKQLNFRFDELANSFMLRRRVTTGRIDTTNYESYDRVLKNKRGICVSLSLLYLMLAEKLGLPIYPVFMPRHVFVRYDDGRTRINIETTAQGARADDSYYRKKFDLDHAQKIYGRTLDNYRIIGAYLNNMGVYFQLQGRYADSIELHRLDTQINPELAGSYSNLGAAYLEAGLTGQAVLALEKARALAPNDTDTLVNLGFAFQRAGSIKDSVLVFRKVLAMDPNDPGAYDGLGLTYLKSGDLKKAEDNFRTAIHLDSGFENAYNNLGVLYDRKGDLTRAIHMYRTAIDINRNRPETHANLGNAYQKTGNNEYAVYEYESAIKLQPDDPSIHYNFALLCHKMGRREQAEQEYREALRLDPKEGLARYNLGVLYQEMNRKADAVETYLELIKADPGNIQGRYNLGAAYQEMGEDDMAIEQYEKILGIKPGNADVHYNMGLIYHGRKDYENAISEYKKAVKYEPSLKAAYHNMGVAYQELGQDGEAEKCFKKAGE